jgi:hypothetical protein
MRLHPSLCVVAICACGEADLPSDARPSELLPPQTDPGSACSPELTEISPLSVDDGTTSDPSPGEVPRFVRFIDPTSGCVTDRVHDADRELVFFDAGLGALVSLDSGNTVSGWTVNEADLAWSRSGVRFRVRFGTEDGERRAYFTETGPGTICNLNVAGPDTLFISATSQTPPNP